MTNRPIFIALSPNTEKDDVMLALKLIFRSSKWQRGKEIKRLEEAFKKYFKVNFAISFLAGRTALWAILKSLRIREGDEVLLQAYTCVVVPNSIVSLKALPVWVDINPETFNMEVEDFKKKITKRSRVVIIQHTFGQGAKIEKIVEISKKHKLFVIEDCAQALGGEYRGKKLGTFGDVAFFSFGRTKIISSVFGGMVITDNKKMGERLRKIQDSLPFPSRLWILQQLFHPLAFSLIIPAYSLLNFGKILHFLLTKLGLLSKDVSFKEKAGKMSKMLFSKMPNVLSILALKQFERLEEFNGKRREIARLYSRELKGLDIELPKIKKDFHHIFLRYTIKTDKTKELIDFAKKRKIFLGDWYHPVIAPKSVNLSEVFYQLGSCPKAEKAARMSVNLPTYPKMTIEDVKRVVEIIREFYGN